MSNDWGRSSVEAMLNELRWEPLAERRKSLRLAMLFKIMNGMVSIPAVEYLKLNTRTTRNNSTNTQTLIPYNCRLDTYKDSFFPRTIEDWNKLPETSVTSNTIEQFKSSLSRRQ